MRQTGIVFTEVRVPLYTTLWQETIRTLSPTAKVPVLVDGTTTVWESLAICEYLADKFPELRLWPAAFEARGVARAISAEMHSGFQNMRARMPMNTRRRSPSRNWKPEVANEIARVISIWNDTRERFGTGGPFLFGEFSIADAMYAPVVSRFNSYSVDLEAEAARYSETILNLAAMRTWYAEAESETEVIASYEA